MIILDEKRNFKIRNEIFRLESQFLHWKEIFYSGNKIFTLKTRHLGLKQVSWIGNKIFKLKTRFYIKNTAFRLKTVF